MEILQLLAFHVLLHSAQLIRLDHTIALQLLAANPIVQYVSGNLQLLELV